MQIEHIAGVGFAAGRAPQEKRQLTVGLSMLRKVVINTEDMLAVPHEFFAHRAARVRRQVLQGRGV